MEKIKDCDLSRSKKEIFHVDSSLPWVKYQNYVQPIHLKVAGRVNWQKHYMKIKKNLRDVWSESWQLSIVSKNNFWQKHQLPVDWQIDICKYYKKQNKKRRIKVANMTIIKWKSKNGKEKFSWNMSV